MRFLRAVAARHRRHPAPRRRRAGPGDRAAPGLRDRGRRVGAAGARPPGARLRPRLARPALPPGRGHLAAAPPPVARRPRSAPRRRHPHHPGVARAPRRPAVAARRPPRRDVPARAGLRRPWPRWSRCSTDRGACFASELARATGRRPGRRRSRAVGGHGPRPAGLRRLRVGAGRRLRSPPRPAHPVPTSSAALRRRPASHRDAPGGGPSCPPPPPTSTATSWPRRWPTSSSSGGASCSTTSSPPSTRPCAGATSSGRCAAWRTAASSPAVGSSGASRGEQFALPQAAEALQAIRKAEPTRSQRAPVRRRSAQPHRRRAPRRPGPRPRPPSGSTSPSDPTSGPGRLHRRTAEGQAPHRQRADDPQRSAPRRGGSTRP